MAASVDVPGAAASEPAPSSPIPARLAAVLTVLAAALTPGVPWYVGPVAIGLAAIAALDAHWIWAALGACLFWAPAVTGPAAALVLVGAIVLGALRWRALSTVVIVTALAIALKQEAVAPVLPTAVGVVPALVLTLVAAAGAVSAARGGRVEAAALALAGGIVLARVGFLWSVQGVARVEAAARIGAIGLVYDGLTEGAPNPALAAALLRAAPDRDAAALALGWPRALDLGWRPARADGVVVPVARALEARGRGGEALRLLARHPRTGEVDALRSLLERVQGVPVHWQGAPLGPALPGRVALALVFDTNAWAPVEFTAGKELDGLVVEGVGDAYKGPALLEVWLDDDRKPISWALDGPAELALPGPVSPGPHRLGVRFMNDLADDGGDRNARIVGIRAE